MGNEIRESIAKKRYVYYGNPKAEDEKPYKFATYEEAQAAGSIKGMIHMKRMKNQAAHRSVISLSNEYYETLSISDILKNLELIEKSTAEIEELKDACYQREFDRVLRDFLKTGANRDLARGKVFDYMNSWDDKEYSQLVSEYAESKKKLTAFSNARDRYIDEHKDLIEAERARVRREELLTSGLLESMGIVSSDEDCEN